MEKIKYEEVLASQIRKILGLTEKEVVTEQYNCKPRKFRSDVTLPWCHVTIEINGGNWTAGRHTRPAQLLNEYEKMNILAERGWFVFYFTPAQVLDYTACDRIVGYLRGGTK